MTNPTTHDRLFLGLSDEAYYAAFETLQILLADEMVLAQKLRKYHWNKPNTGYTKDFPESTLNFFYKSDKWTKWTTPLDQPMLNLYRGPIGPRFEVKEEV